MKKLEMDYNGSGCFENSEVHNSCSEILKNLQARERALKSILESLDLDLSNFGGAVRSKIDDAAEILVNQGITEVNKENIISSYIKKTLKKDEDLSVYTKLVLAKAEINNECVVSKELNSMYNNAIKTYEHGIKKVTEELNHIVGPTILSPDTKASTFCSEQRDLRRRVSVLCQKLFEKKKTAKELSDKLSAYHGLPTDVESAKHEVFLKQKELEEVCELFEDLNLSQ